MTTILSTRLTNKKRDARWRSTSSSLNSLKKSATSLPAVIAIMDESDRQINFNSLKKFMTSLPVAITIKMSPITRSVLDDFKKSTT
jgi:hypothetical protein